MRFILGGAMLLLLTACSLWADEPRMTEPILLTSCGQSADVLMVKTLLSRDSLVFAYKADATGADVEGKGSVLLVLGGSSKGLGAAKISEADELARVTSMVVAAQKANVPILAVHIGGLNRRGALSDPFNRIGAENAARIIVTKGGNDDGFFTTLAGESIPLVTIDNALGLSPALKSIYRVE